MPACSGMPELAARPPRPDRGPDWGLDRALGATAWLVVLFLLGPLLVIMGGSFTETPFVAFPPRGFTLRWYAQLMHRPDFLAAFGFSVVLALLCCLGALLLGVPAAVGLHRHLRQGSWGGATWRAFLVSPLVLPTVVTGVALLQLFTLADVDPSLPGLLAAHVLVTLPYVVRLVGAGLRALDPALEEAAESLGAGAARVLWRVTLPAVAPSAAAASILVFVTSFDQVTVSLFLAGPGAMPLPVRIYTYVDYAVDPMVAAVSTLMILFAFALVAVLQRVLGLDRAIRLS